MYYGWLIVAGAFIAQLFVTGFFTYGFPLIVMPVQHEFDVSRTEVMYGITWATALGLVVAPLIGILADKWSIKNLMAIGAVSLGLGLILLSKSESILQFSLLFALFICLSNNLLGPLTGSTVVSRWFSASRGKALGIAAVGTSMGGLIIPYMVDLGIANIGWRDMLFYFGLTVLIILLPYLLLAVRDFPSEKGLVGEPQAAEVINNQTAGEAADGQDLSAREILAIPAFWFIGATLGFLFMSQTGVLTNIGAYMAGEGLADKTKIFIQTLAGMGLIGKLLFGYAADRINLKFGLWAAIVLASIGVAILASQPAFTYMLVAAVFLGLATGGMLPVWGAIIAVVFGMKSYGRVMGAMMPLIALMVMPGPIIGAKLFDIYGNYVNSFYLFIAVLSLAFICLIPLKLKRLD